MDCAPLIVLNGYPGVGKAAVAAALRKIVPDSKSFDNHLLIDPVAALLDREDAGYRDLRKALRDPVFNCITTNPSLRRQTINMTYYQETFTDRSIDLEDKEENKRRLADKSRESKSKLRDVKILEDILENHFLYSFHDAGFQPPDVWEHKLDITDIEPHEAASTILDIVKKHEKA